MINTPPKIVVDQFLDDDKLAVRLQNNHTVRTELGRKKLKGDGVHV